MRIVGRSISLKTAVTVLLALLGTVSFSTKVLAGLEPELIGSTGTDPFTYIYFVGLGDGFIQTGPVPGASANSGVGVPGNTVASFFTIYDFNGFTGAHTEPADWAFQSLAGNLGSTPSTTLPADNNTVPNLTWYYTGAVVGGSLLITGFSATSSNRDTGALANFTSYNAFGFGNQGFGTAIATIGTVGVPGPSVVATPEPATLLLLSFGLAGLVVQRAWSKRRER